MCLLIIYIWYICVNRIWHQITYDGWYAINSNQTKQHPSDKKRKSDWIIKSMIYIYIYIYIYLSSQNTPASLLPWVGVVSHHPSLHRFSDLSLGAWSTISCYILITYRFTSWYHLLTTYTWLACTTTEHPNHGDKPVWGAWKGRFLIFSINTNLWK